MWTSPMRSRSSPGRRSAIRSEQGLVGGFEYRGWLPRRERTADAANQPGASNGELTLSLAGPAGAFTA